MRPLPAALRPLQRQRRFVLWKWEWRNGKWSKPPVGLDGSFVDATNPRHWLGYDDACDALASMPIGLGSGIGFALQGSGFGALDLDDCRAASSHINILSLWAHRLVKRADSYCEITPSGEGVRILGHADGGEVHRKFGDLEIFRSCRRYITISGDAINNAPLRGIDNLIDTLIAEHAVKPRRSSSTQRVESRVDDVGEDWRSIVRAYAPARMFDVENDVQLHWRSSVIWKIGRSLAESGATREQVAAVLWAARCFQSKHGNNKAALDGEVQRIFKKGEALSP